MSEAENEKPSKPKSGHVRALLIGVVLACLCGGVSYYAVNTGLILPNKLSASHVDEYAQEEPTPTFVALDPLVISLGEGVGYQLRFSAQLEVDGSRKDEVKNLSPRILDVLNGYLRAVDISDLKDPSALIRIRAQMLRRIQIVSGPGSVKDLLITEFVFA